jgi:hypothetical protein
VLHNGWHHPCSPTHRVLTHMWILLPAALTPHSALGPAPAANYTVMVTNLPKQITQHELERKLKCVRRDGKHDTGWGELWLWWCP